ncbi:MAG: type II toxin-antitoxin system PemK/MazF family toxin [Saprospiraceae bacterium]|nr:type II toxin-antitoxin system PemK/MazF family toxin [Saprospiraceae bacterium]
MPTIDLSRTQKYLEWLKTKLFLDSRASSAARRVVLRGDVYKCNLGVGIGSEENKERPCLIIQYDVANINSPNTIVAPITHTASTIPVVVPISDKYDSAGNVVLDGHVLLGNMVCVSKARLGDFVSKLDSAEMIAVDKAIATSLDIKHYYDKLINIHEDKLEYVIKLKEKIEQLNNEIKLKDEEIKYLKEKS